MPFLAESLHHPCSVQIDPVFPMLAIHIDFNCAAFTRKTLSSILHFAASYGYDAVLWEVEDKIQWETCPECVSPDAFSKAEFREILAEAKSLGLAPIPLLQTFGHAEYILSHKPYDAWREVPEKKNCYCVSNPEVRDFLKRFLHEYLEVFGDDVRLFHLGGDEVYSFCKCPVCSRRDRMELYSEHLNAVAGELLARGIRPCCWADMILSCGGDSISRFIPRDFVLWHWSYTYGTPGVQPDYVLKARRLKEEGYDVFFCAAAESAGDAPFLSLFSRHAPNIAVCAAFAREEKLDGFCVTSWSIRGTSKTAQFPLFALGARCLKAPFADAEAEFAAVLRELVGDVSPDALYRLSEWSGGNGFEGRQWNVYKDGIPPMAGRREWIISENHKYTKGYPDAPIAKHEKRIAEIRAALDELRALPGQTAVGEALLAGGSLHERLLRSIVAVERGERLPAIPFLETMRFYAREQTDWSAFNMARCVWGVLDGRYANPYDPNVRIETWN